VAKTVADPSIELRLLAYVYLARHAHEEPDLVLLAINSIQKDLMDPNQLVRASALRCFAGVNVPAVAAVLMLSIKKCMRDTSPFVRKVAAYAIIQLHKKYDLLN
jgi:AP-3 complex subunit beta